ncbi:MAG: histidine phosphatase family protein [Tardiphaga sp.]
MPTTIHLVRHGHHGLLGRVLCGRMPGVELDAEGRAGMAACAALLTPVPSVIQSSPQTRAVQSADILATHFGLAVEVAADVDEIDLGGWTGRSFDELEHDPAWRHWNAHRGSSTPPGGESMGDLQARMIGHIEALCLDRAGDTIAIVSHAEPIRAVVLHYAQVLLDDFLSVEIDPASVTTLIEGATSVQLSRVNQKVAA